MCCNTLLSHCTEGYTFVSSLPPSDVAESENIKTEETLAMDKSKNSLIAVVEWRNSGSERGSMGQHKKTPSSNSAATQSAVS
jgi:hypothetical protein